MHPTIIDSIAWEQNRERLRVKMNPSPSSSSQPLSGPSKPSRPLGAPKPPPNPKPIQTNQPGGAIPANVPRRHAGAVPGIARAASNLRQSSPLHPSTGPLASLPAHLRNLSTPKIPSPLGKGTPARGLKQSLPVRTSKTTEKHVFLPEDPQLAPLPKSPMGSQVNLTAPPRPSSIYRDRRDGSHGFGGLHQDERSDAEKMTKREREEARLPRLTAYTTAEGYRLKLLQAFLKREHGVGVVRVFDDCLYAVYNLPLLPGYGASTKIRSSPAVKSPGGVSLLERMTQAEDLGYDDSYFPAAEDTERDPHISADDPSEYILSHSPPSPMEHLSRRDIDEQDRNRMEGGEGDDGERGDRLEDIQDALDRGDALTIRDGHDHVRLDDSEDLDPIITGTQMSPERPGYLQHVPSLALSPEDLAAPVHHHHHTMSELESQLELVLEAPTSPPRQMTRSVSQPAQIPRVHYTQHRHSNSDASTTVSQPRYPLTHARSHSGIPRSSRRRKSHSTHNQIAEAVFFSYGVSVFFGFQEDEEHAVMEDIDAAGGWIRGMKEDDWEVEEFHYVVSSAGSCPPYNIGHGLTTQYDSDADYPRIYNDMFTFKSHSHLFKLSLSHAVAQSTKLSIYESTMTESLALTSSFPKELSTTGHLQLRRREALKMTGRLFKLRMDVNLIGGILDTPELFWSEASLFPLYEAIREYLEIGPRVQVLNDRLAVAGDLLEIIHEYIEERATNRINWIIIWLIIVACIVEAGEVFARIIFHNLPREEGEFLLVKGSRAIWGATIGVS